MKKITIKLIFIGLFWGFNFLAAQNAYIVKDISPITKPSNPEYLILHNNEIYFFADDGVHGKELWKTDGTVVGTTMVKDINPTGNGIGQVYTTPLKFVSINTILYFIGNNGIYGNELWRTDGTAIGTYMVKDIGTNWSEQPEFLTNLNDTLFFGCGGDLWKSDGTLNGTVIVKSGVNPKNITTYGNKIIFSGYISGNGEELMSSDGTTSGTILVKDISSSGGSYPHKFTLYDNKLYFSANISSYINQLWHTDGTSAGTIAVLDSLGIPLPSPVSLAVSNNILYVGSTDIQQNGLWRTDGTQNGTVKVKSFQSLYSTTAEDLFDMNGVLYFLAKDTTVGTLEPLNKSLWTSDGTANGTQFVKVINSTNPWWPNSFTNFQNTLFMSAYDSSNGYELWKSDGTSNGTSIVKNIYPNAGNSSPSSFIVLNNKLFFVADDNLNGRELWVTDGTNAGTAMLIDINKIKESNICQLTKVNNQLFFSAKTAINNEELWVSDGTDSGTHLVKDIAPANKIGPQYLTELIGFAYFSTPDSAGAGIYKSDGTAAGTVLIKNWTVQGMKKVDNKLFGYSPGFWMSDGTTAGTFLIPNGSSTENMVSLNGTYYLQNSSGISKSDGTPAGAQILMSFQNCSNLISTTNSIYFSALDNNSIRGLWKSDGTVNGTVLIKPIRTKNLLNINDTICFSADSNYTNNELWKSDGPFAGTVMLKDINISGSSNPINLTNINGVLYFNADDGIHGLELWKSDGTPTGTMLVKDINNGTQNAFSTSNDSLPYFTYADGLVYFTANDGVNGFELWQSDGTASGTNLVEDLNPNGSSFPKEITLINGSLFFTAYNSTHGRALWSKGLSTITNCYAHFTTSYDSLQNNFILNVDSTTSSLALAYLWDFGDGVSSTIANPSHTYISDGVYNLCLKVHTTLGDSCIYCHEIGKDSLGNIIRNGGFTVIIQNGNSTDVKNSFLSNENKLIIYPNPSKGEALLLFNQPMNNATISILNLMGQKIAEKTNQKGNEFRIDISNQVAGMYFIEIEENEKVLRTKLIKN